jgi:hypothetical protein
VFNPTFQGVAINYSGLRVIRRAKEICMHTPFLTLIAAVGLIAFAAADRRAAAQQPPTSAIQASSSSAPAGEIRHTPEVIITGQRELATKITGFVNQLTDFDYGDSNRGLARWQDPVCPLVTGLPQDMAEYILGRLSEIARAAGVPLARESCHHENLFIIVNKDPETYLREQEQQHGAAIFGGAAPMLINEFIATPRPVRTWYDTIERTPEGLPMYRMAFPGNSTRAVAGPGGITVMAAVQSNSGDGNTVLANPWSQASHLVLNVVWAIRRV